MASDRRGERKREIHFSVSRQQRKELASFYSSAGSTIRALKRALAIPDPTHIHLSVTPSELEDILAVVEADYELSRGNTGNQGSVLSQGLWRMRNTLALCKMYGITGDEYAL